MSAVYRNAMITISATASRSGDEGLFRQCPEVLVRPRVRESPTFVFHPPRIHMDRYSVSQEEFPLLSRAWALQERLLSLRVLHFTNTELVFECITDQRCECKGIRDVDWRDSIQQTKCHLAGWMPHSGPTEIWEDVVMQYSNRQLSYPSDKLVAIAGLAKNFRHPGHRYLAGLWANGLIDQLQWFVRGKELPIQARPTWRAPSWSWAAVQTPVHYYFLNRLRPSTESYSAATAEVLNCSVVSNNADPYVEVLSGTLQLLARSTQVSWKRIAQPPDDWRGNDLNCIIFPSGYQIGFYLDALIDGRPSPGTEAENLDITCVLLAEDYCFRHRRLLVLRRLDSDKNIFERIGLAYEMRRRGLFMENADNIFPKEQIVVEIV